MTYITRMFWPGKMSVLYLLDVDHVNHYYTAFAAAGLLAISRPGAVGGPLRAALPGGGLVLVRRHLGAGDRHRPGRRADPRRSLYLYPLYRPVHHAGLGHCRFDRLPAGDPQEFAVRDRFRHDAGAGDVRRLDEIPVAVLDRRGSPSAACLDDHARQLEHAQQPRRLSLEAGPGAGSESGKGGGRGRPGRGEVLPPEGR